MSGSSEPISPTLAATAARSWWDQHAVEYLEVHGPALKSRLQWGPEGWNEADLGLLGAVNGKRILEVGSGACQCSQWLAAEGAEAIATDISLQMLENAGSEIPRVCAESSSLPFANSFFDITFSSYGALPFVSNPVEVLKEWKRVTKSKIVFSVTHPFRWALRDDPNSLLIEKSYFDRTPYFERELGKISYIEFHRTIQDWVDIVQDAGLALERLVEPTWKDAPDWDGWSRKRGELIPGTLIVIAKIYE